MQLYLDIRIENEDIVLTELSNTMFSNTLQNCSKSSLNLTQARATNIDLHYSYLFIRTCVAILSKHKATNETWVTVLPEETPGDSSTDACSKHRFTYLENPKKEERNLGKCVTHRMVWIERTSKGHLVQLPCKEAGTSFTRSGRSEREESVRSTVVVI